MYKLETENSSRALHPTLDLFSSSSALTGVESAKFVEHFTQSSIETPPYEFRIVNNKNFLDLANSHILVRYKLVDSQGKDLDKTKLGAEAVATTNFLGGALFKMIKVYIGGKEIYNHSDYNYRTFMTTLLSHSPEFKKNTLVACGYSEGEDPTDATDTLFLARSNVEKDSSEREVVAPLWCAPFNQPKAILPYTDLRIIAYPASDDFLIERRAGSENYKLKITSCSLIVHEIAAPSSLTLELDKTIREKGAVTYTSLDTVVRTLYINPGVLHVPHFKIFSNVIPRRIFIGLIDTASYTGRVTSNAFNFKNFGLKNVKIQAGSEVLPFTDYDCNYSKDLYMKAYTGLQQTLGNMNNGISNGITPARFKASCCIYGFDISCSDPDYLGLVKIGDTSVSFSFDKDTPATGLYAIVLAEVVTNLTLDGNRNANVY